MRVSSDCASGKLDLLASAFAPGNGWPSHPNGCCPHSKITKYIWRTPRFLVIAAQQILFMPGFRIPRSYLFFAIFSVLLPGRVLGQDARAIAHPAAAETPSLDYQNQSSQEITQVILRGYDRWNAQDMDGYMEMFWKSPNFLYAVDNEIFWGWDQVRAALARGYPNRSAMGTLSSERMEIRVLTSDLATIVNSWEMRFPNAKVVGITTGTLRKFPEGWRVISGHTSSSELPIN